MKDFAIFNLANAESHEHQELVTFLLSQPVIRYDSYAINGTDHGSFTLAPHCPTMSDCTLMCPNGNKKGPDGCYRCQCKDFANDDGNSILLLFFFSLDIVRFLCYCDFFVPIASSPS